MDPNYVSFGIILDDIVFPDGNTRMGVLGGGGPQAVFGMGLWSQKVGLVSGVGSDFPEHAEQWLRDFGIDLTGIRRNDYPTVRAWQVLEEDGTRRQVWRVPGGVIQTQLQRKPGVVPLGFQKARGFHIGIHPLEVDVEFIKSLKKLGGLISIEPFRPSERQLTKGEAIGLLELTDIFSPNREEGCSMFGELTNAELVRRILDLGAKTVALRLGKEGSLVVNGATGQAVIIPSLPIQVVDPVGAGNAYCGGFLVGWAETHDLIYAGICGAVSASFMVEQVGLPAYYTDIEKAALHRMGELHSQVKTMKI